MQSQDQHEPSATAANMVMLRGREQALARCDRYISGAIRSENPRQFWEEVRAVIAAGEVA